MCFQEFIGYTCGHCSLPVLRPCPMTTDDKQYPRCSLAASKPFLAEEMCATCQKAMHRRAVAIEEYEHRFMHERGVCGCTVKFPKLIRPRVIGLANKDMDPGQDNEETSSVIPPLYQETYHDGQLAISIRQNSLYGAEWVADHQERHARGECHCRVDFRLYQEIKNEQNAVSPVEEIRDMPPLPLPAPRLQYGEANPAYPSISQPIFRSSTLVATPGPSWGPISALSEGEVKLVSPIRTLSPEDATIYPQSTSRSMSEFGPAIKPWGTGIESRPQQSVPEQQAVQSSGAVFKEAPAYLHLTGRYLARPSAHTESITHPPATDKQTYQYQQPEPPLVGYPIGAGPEGVPHSAPWRSCPMFGHVRRTQSFS